MTEKLLQKKAVNIDGFDFLISKLPACQGISLIPKFGFNSLPKMGELEQSISAVIEMMQYVAIATPTKSWLILSSKDLIDNQLASSENPWETLSKVTMAMLEYNCSFFQKGRVSGFLDELMQTLPQKVTEILTGVLQRLSAAEKQL
jgi:hypothetical protein